MENLDLIFRDENGSFVDCIKASTLKKKFQELETDNIRLTSYWANDGIVYLEKRFSYFIVFVNSQTLGFSRRLYNHFPEKRLMNLIKEMQIDTIEINN